MADEQQEASPSFALVNPSDPDIKTVYANNTYIELGDSEVGLIFGYDYYDNGKKVDKPSVRVVLSHDSFMKMVEFWEKRAKFFRRVYANRVPNVYAGDPREYRAAMDELFSPASSAQELINDDTNRDASKQ